MAILIGHCTFCIIEHTVYFTLDLELDMIRDKGYTVRKCSGFFLVVDRQAKLK